MDWIGYENYFPIYEFPSLTGTGFINLYNGSLNIQESDFSLPSRGFTLDFSRSYSSNNKKDGIIGKGWISNLEERLEIKNDHVNYYDADGTIHKFIKLSDGSFSIPNGTSYQLSFSEITGYVLETINGSLTKKYFNREGRLTEITDPSSNTVKFQYEGSILRKVMSSNKNFSLNYNAEGNISEVNFSTGEKIILEYQDNYLTLVKLLSNLGNEIKSFRYRYEDDGKLSEIVWKNGLNLSFNYNGERVIKINSKLSTRKIDSSNNFPLVTYGSIVDSINYKLDENKIYISVDSNDNKNLASREYVLNSNGNLSKQKIILDGKAENSIETSTEYENNRLRSITDSLGNRTEYIYDTYGNVIEQILPAITEDGVKNIYSIKMSYNSKGQLTKSINTKGQVAEWKYDNKGNLIEYIDQEGNHQYFKYDIYGNLIETKSQRGPLYSFIPDFSFENENLSNWKTSGTVKKDKSKAVSGKQSIQIGSNSSIQSEKIPIKKGRLPVLALISGMSANNSGKVEFKIQFLKNETIIKEYSQSYSLLSNWQRLDLSTEIPSDATHLQIYLKNTGTSNIYIDDLVLEESELQTRYIYDNNGENVIEVIDPYGIKTTYTYNKYGQILTETNVLNQTKSYAYNDKFELIKVTDRMGRNTEYRYDNIGNVVEEKNNLGQSILYEYNEWGQLLSIRYPNVTMTYYVDEKANRSEVKEVKVYIEYDELGRVVKETDKNGNASAKEYDSNGRVVKSIDRMQNQKEFTYDKNGNVIHTRDLAASFDSNKVDLIAKGEMYATYDEWNRQLTETDNTGNRNVLTMINKYDSENRLIHTKDADGTEIFYEYNNLGENIYSKDNSYPAVETWTYYDGLGTSAIINSSGTIEFTVTDANGNLIETVDYKGIKTVFEYNQVGDKVKQINSDGSTVEWTYNKEGQVISEKRQTEETSEIKTYLITTYEYNQVGEVVKQKLDGQIIDKINNRSESILLKESTYSYDELGRFIRETSKYFEEGNPNKYKKSDVRFLYDLNGNLIRKWIYDESSATINQLGQTTLPFVRSESKIEYDLNNRFIREEKVENNIVTVKTYKDDENAEVISSALGVTVTYFNENDLESKTITPRNEQYQFTYTPNKLKDKIIGPRITVDMDYFSNNKLSTITTRKKDSTSVIFSEKYNYNSKEQIISAENSWEGKKQYTYTSEGFLETVTRGNETITYSYDINGNLLKAVNQNGITLVENQYNTGNQISTSIQYDSTDKKYRKITYTFTAEGSLKEEKYYQKADTVAKAKSSTQIEYTKIYEFSSLNLLRSITTKKNNKVIEKIEYTYNSEDLRTSKIVTTLSGKRIEFYYYDANGDLVSISEKVGNDSVENLINIFRDSSRQLLSFEYKGDIYDYVYNQRGDIVAITNELQQVIVRYSYDEWGNLLQAQGLNEIGKEIVEANPFRYVGKFGVVYDKDSKFYYMGWREYDSKLGRFIVADEYKGEDTNPISFNRYLYAEADPVNNIDPDGYWAKWLSNFFEGVKKTVKAAYDFMIGDDINTLLSSNTKWEEKVLAAVGLVLNVNPITKGGSLLIKAAKGVSFVAKGSNVVSKVSTKVTSWVNDTLQVSAKKASSKVQKKSKSNKGSQHKSIKSTPKNNSKAQNKGNKNTSKSKSKTPSKPKSDRGSTEPRVTKTSDDGAAAGENIGVKVSTEGTSKTFGDYALNATKNANSNKVVLGKYMQNNVSYVDVATKQKATYFQLDNWDEVASTIGSDNMWNINKEFLNQQWKAGKDFYFSHNPWEATGYFQQEVLHLIDLGVKDFIQVGNNLWKAVK